MGDACSADCNRKCEGGCACASTTSPTVEPQSGRQITTTKAEPFGVISCNDGKRFCRRRCSNSGTCHRACGRRCSHTDCACVSREQDAEYLTNGSQKPTVLDPVSGCRRHPSDLCEQMRDDECMCAWDKQQQVCTKSASCTGWGLFGSR